MVIGKFQTSSKVLTVRRCDNQWFMCYFNKKITLSNPERVFIGYILPQLSGNQSYSFNFLVSKNKG